MVAETLMRVIIREVCVSTPKTPPVPREYDKEKLPL